MPPYRRRFSCRRLDTSPRRPVGSEARPGVPDWGPKARRAPWSSSARWSRLPSGPDRNGSALPVTQPAAPSLPGPAPPHRTTPRRTSLRDHEGHERSHGGPRIGHDRESPRTVTERGRTRLRPHRKSGPCFRRLWVRFPGPLSTADRTSSVPRCRETSVIRSDRAGAPWPLPRAPEKPAVSSTLVVLTPPMVARSPCDREDRSSACRRDGGAESPPGD